MLERLEDNSIWEEYLAYKTSHTLLNRGEEKALKEYVSQGRGVLAARELKEKGYSFSAPKKHLVNKMGSEKKRVVYTFPYDESMVLKLISYLLYEYDGFFAPNCYAFRKDAGAKKALYSIINTYGIDGMWRYKLDISDYFNSIDVKLLLEKLKPVVKDGGMFSLLKGILENDTAEFDGRFIHERHGAMAGTPISPFLANVYLSDMDRYFSSLSVPYARYSDDIIILGSEEEIRKHIKTVERFLEDSRLTKNREKEHLIPPGHPFEFLGFKYSNGKIGISDAAVQKMVNKIRRRSHAIRRWKLKTNADDIRAMRAMTRTFNKKFYDLKEGDGITWSRWYFPVLNCDDGLKEIDAYFQQQLRYIATGRHNKANVKKVPYALLRECGYRPLVSEYWKQKSALK